MADYDAKWDIAVSGKIYEDYSEDDPTVAWTDLEINAKLSPHESVANLADLVRYAFGDVLCDPVAVEVRASKGRIEIVCSVVGEEEELAGG